MISLRIELSHKKHTGLSLPKRYTTCIRVDSDRRYLKTRSDMALRITGELRIRISSLISNHIYRD